MQFKPIIFIVDDDPRIRTGLRHLFASAGLEVQAFESGPALFDAMPTATPGCIVLDVSMPGMSGLDVQRELVNRGVRTPTIFLTGSANISMAVEAMRAGAADFLEKPVDNAALLSRVQRALALESQNRSQDLERAEVGANLARLTPREREVMQLIVAGKSSKTIGQILRVSPRTVDVHRARVMDKMRADSLADLVRRVLQLGQGI